MSKGKFKNYEHIAQAIAYLSRNFDGSFDLPMLGQQVMLSPYHLVRLIREWSGTNPEELVRYLKPEYRKRIIAEEKDAYYKPHVDEMNNTGRYHDLFVNIKRISEKEKKSLKIDYSTSNSPFGSLLIASTRKGICYLSFTESKAGAESFIKENYPNASIREDRNEIILNALKIFDYEKAGIDNIPIHLDGTDFQIQVWEQLLKIPFGGLTTYGNLADAIGKPGGARAVGSAIGKNPIGFLIPCHRVVNVDGTSGNYRWGETRKKAMIAWEAAKYHNVGIN